MSEIKTILNFFDKNNGLDNIIKDLKEVKKLQSEINKQKGAIGSDNLKERTAALKEITRLQKQLDKERKKAINTGKQAVGIEKELVKVQEQDRKVKKQLKVARTERFRDLQETNLALRNQKKLVKADIIENSKLSSVYERQSAKLNRLRKELKNLILTEGESSVKTKKLAAQVQNLDSKLKKADAAAGQFQRNVGNYPNALKRATGALRNFAGALGITAGITGLVRALGNAINIAKDFEQGNANLAAVLGKTKDEIGALTDDAKRLGAATAFSATQVSQLQTEFAKLGFSETEILNATEATLSLAAATGSDLGEAAAIAGATLGGFGLEADETQRVVDVMAKSFSTSALDITKFQESMKNAAPAAKAVGIDVEETTALLGTLANAGISGSRAGNNLKTSFINLNKAGLTLQQGLEKVSKSEDKLGTAAKLVGKNAAASFLVLAEGVDTTEELARGLRNAGGAAEKMAKEQLNTLEGRLTILNSAWEGFVLGLLSGDSAFSKMSKSIVEATTNLLGFLTPTEALGKETQKLSKEFDEQEKVLNPLLDRYDELKEQGELNEKQQTELEGVINDIVEIVPEAATGFDVYGKALDINKDKVIANTEAQKALLEELAGQDIEEIGESFITATKDIDIFQDRIKQGIANSAEAFKLTGELRRELTAAEAAEAGVGVRTLDQDIRDNIQTLIKFGLTQEEIIELFDKSGRANDRQRERFLENLKVVNEGNKVTKTQAEIQAAIAKALGESTELIEEETEAKEGLTEAEKALVAAMEDEWAARDAIQKQLEIDAEKGIEQINDELKAKEALARQNEMDAIIAAKELENKQEAAKFQEDLSKFSKELQQEDFDTFVEFSESGFATFKEFEDAKRKELEDTAKLQDKLEKERAEAQKEAIKQSKEAVDAVIGDLTRESEAKIEALDRQINAEQDFLSQNENLSAREIEFRREKAAELERQRIEEQQRLERLAKTQAFFDLVAAFASDGDGQGAVGKAATVIAAGEAITQGFHDGGYTGDGNEYKEAGVVHKGEFVNTKSQTTEYGMKGWSAKDFDNAISDGYFNQFADSNIFADQNAKFLSVQGNEIGYDFKNLESVIREEMRGMVNNMPTSNFAIEGGHFVTTKTSKGKTLITKKKLG